MELRGSFHQWSIKQPVTVSKLKSLRGRAWMIYAFVISHLLKQGVNVFVPCTSQACRDGRARHGTNALQENSKVNQAICPDAPLFSSILSWRCNDSGQLPCESFVNPLCLSFHDMICRKCTLWKGVSIVNVTAVLRENISVTHLCQRLQSSALIHFYFDK